MGCTEFQVGHIRVETANLDFLLMNESPGQSRGFCWYIAVF
jgi:hypothetical protein